MIQIDDDMFFDAWPTDSRSENVSRDDLKNVKVGDFVHCAGESDDIFKVEQINKNNNKALMHTGVWEPISKLTVLDPKKVSYYTQTIYIYDKEGMKEE